MPLNCHGRVSGEKEGRSLRLSMRLPTYIFVDDQGGVFSCDDEPTAEDLAHAALGVVTIIRVADFHSYGPQRKWVPIRHSEPASVAIDGSESPPFHW